MSMIVNGRDFDSTYDSLIVYVNYILECLIVYIREFMLNGRDLDGTYKRVW